MAGADIASAAAAAGAITAVAAKRPIALTGTAEIMEMKAAQGQFAPAAARATLAAPRTRAAGGPRLGTSRLGMTLQGMALLMQQRLMARRGMKAAGHMAGRHTPAAVVERTSVEAAERTAVERTAVAAEHMAVADMVAVGTGSLLLLKQSVQGNLKRRSNCFAALLFSVETHIGGGSGVRG